MIRLYGQEGIGSFSVVTEGIRSVLEKQGNLAGFLPITQVSEYEDYGGETAKVALVTGVPLSVNKVPYYGDHEETWLMLAVNSEGVPGNLASCLRGYVQPPFWKEAKKAVTGFLAPSSWNARVLEKTFPEHKVVLCRHGVGARFRRIHKRRQIVAEAFDKGHFACLHVSSTWRQRKGTRELLVAWKAFEKKHPKAVLHLSVNPQWVLLLKEEVAHSGCKSVEVLTGLHASDEQYVQALSGYHAVVQPSRSEGFGLVPLEARVCGIPAVATACTGHADHHHGPGAIVVPHKDLAEVDDFEGAEAPEVSPEDILEALEKCFDQWVEYHAKLADENDFLRKFWSWESQSGSALRSLLESGKQE